MSNERSSRIAKNTFFLYIQMFLGLILGLYTSRVVLNELGIEDFGLYNVVGGIVSMLGMLNMSMSASTTRFITFELGRNSGNTKQIFGLSLSIHSLLAIIVVLLAEVLGLWFIEYKMSIPVGRENAVHWVFHCSLIATFISIVNVPYNAMIVAYEKMAVYAYFSIIELLLKLGIVFLLPLTGYDKLVFYAVLLVGVQVLMQGIYFAYCFYTFKDSRVGLLWDKEKFKEMFSFAGWNLIGDSSAVLFTHGVNLLLNVFFGPTVNAARGVALQVQGVIQRFIAGFQTALNPQIIKSYAAGDMEYMHRLVFTSSKFSFFLFLIIGLPVFFEAKLLLTLWLKIVPAYTVEFLRLIILISLIDCLANPLVVSAKATGNIKQYQLILGTFLLFIVPICYVFLQLGYDATTVFYVHLIMAIIAHTIRLYLVGNLIKLNILEYLNNVVLRVLLVVGLSWILPYYFYYTFPSSYMRFILLGISAVIGVSVLIWTIGLNRLEKDFLIKKIKRN